MKHTFYINDYYDEIDELEEKHDSFFSSLKQFFVKEDDISETYTYGMRIVIPEYHLSFRFGITYDKEDNDCMEEAIIVYDEEEKDPSKYIDIIWNSELSFAIHEYKTEQQEENPQCFYDDEEFVFW